MTLVNRFDRNRAGIAYFSMEIALRGDIPTYSGGLGVLAGDTVRSAADLNVPLVAVSLVSRKGYFKQKLRQDGEQTELPADWDPAKTAEELPTKVSVKIKGRDVLIRAYNYSVSSPKGGTVPVLLLDTDFEANPPEDRTITHYLYGGDLEYRLKQEIVLGVGGVRMLDALGFKISRYHMNEGHSALLALELLRQSQLNVDRVKSMCIFTTHTPVEAAFDKFDYPLVERVLGELVPSEIIRRYGGEDRLNMTLLALNLSDYINGVSKSYGEYSAKLFPGYKVHAITNGVHSFTWTCTHFKRLFDRYLPGWADEPSLLTRVGIIPDELILDAHREAKEDLFACIKRMTGVEMDPKVLTIGFARRATGYKRPTLIFSDTDRLRKIARRWGIQIVFGGKSHPKDETGKRMIKEVFWHIRELKDEIKMVYLEDYDLDLSKMMVAGVDVWLNTPQPPMEASGTSGMKAAHNGVLNFSVLDGWWVEGWIEGVTGWSIGPRPGEKISPEERNLLEREDLYNKLNYIICPTFYEGVDSWATMMQNSISILASYFNSHRMMRRYVTEAYL
ncbi:MAG: alpha-glucan family phosphorylase [Candidatus Verstraetearchaeota archaeon]|nr:alpha-glucan family phosphorylase [Candidatus Verstraetearchaeota archaeon]